MKNKIPTRSPPRRQGHTTNNNIVYHTGNQQKMYHVKNKGNRENQLQQNQNKCVICNKITQQCCSLCMKAHYCCAEHQETDWHTKHKFICEGRDPQQIQALNKNHYHAQLRQSPNKFAFYSRNKNISQTQTPNIKQHQAQQAQMKKTTKQKQQSYLLIRQQEQKSLNNFLELLHQRLVFRNKILNQISQINARSPDIVKQSLVKQTEQLLELSTEITKKQYKPSYAKKIFFKENQDGGFHTSYSSQKGAESLAINQLGLLMEYVSDHVLLTKVYISVGMKKEIRQILIGIGRLLQDTYQEKVFLSVPQLSGSEMISQPEKRAQNYQSLLSQKSTLLQSIIQLSDTFNIDRTTEQMYKLYIKQIQQFEGIWQTIYGYFNIGVWYLNKTYYHKANKAFIYVLELLDSHKKNYKEGIVLKADIMYNLGLSYWLSGEKVLAIQSMQEAYKNRVNGIGKNSIQASNCLEILAKWFFKQNKWEQCLQYLEQCHRIRKQYQDSQSEINSLNSIKKLIVEVHQALQQHSQKFSNKLDSNAQNYYQKLLQSAKKQENQQHQRQLEEDSMFPEELSVAKRLFADDQDQYMQFCINITPQMIETYNSKQVEYLSQLFQLSDKKIQIKQSRKIIHESLFYDSLSEKQRQQFIKVNNF